MADNRSETDSQNDLKQAERSFQQLVSLADESRVGALDHLGSLRQTKAVQWERERTRLTGLLGANHPMVGELTGKIETNERMVKAITMVADQAKTDLPKVDKVSWVIHGRVRNRDLAPCPGLTVALSDRERQWTRQVGYERTDKTGYFLLRSVTKEAGGAAGGRDSNGPVAEVHLQVLDAEGTTLYIDKEPLAPQPGHIYYREIVLSEEAGRSPDDDEQRPPGRKTKPTK